MTIHPSSSRKGLLETLADQTDCLYLSNLRVPGWYQPVGLALRSIDPSEFRMDEWNEAVLYITGRTEAFSAPDDARNYLLQFIREPFDTDRCP